MPTRLAARLGTAVTTPAAQPWRRLPIAARLTIVTLAGGLVLAALAVLLVTIGIVGYGKAAPAGDQDRDLEHVRTDPAGAYACDALDRLLAGGLGTFEDAQDRAETSNNPAIRDATTADDMYAACVAAGSNMSPR